MVAGRHSEQEMMMRTVLITGAAGRIGTFLAGQLAGRYALRLSDRVAAATDVAPFVPADLAVYDQVRAACDGIDTVVHLGADPRVDAPWEALLPANIAGAYHVFEAAAAAGCRRVVFASSINAMGAYPRDTQIRTDMPLRPANLYGATKAWGEILGRLYADTRGLSALCLRFGAVITGPQHLWIAPDSPLMSAVLTLRDLTALVCAAIDAPERLRFGIYHGVSANRWQRMDLGDTRDDLGYDPQDDAFAMLPAPGAEL
jgi:UDP-glucose 4-epimerase